MYKVIVINSFQSFEKTNVEIADLLKKTTLKNIIFVSKKSSQKHIEREFIVKEIKRLIKQRLISKNRGDHRLDRITFQDFKNKNNILI